MEGHSDLLVCWVTGECARVADEMEDEEVESPAAFKDRRTDMTPFSPQISSGVMSLLRRFKGDDASLPAPRSVLRNAWTSDPRTRGAFSFPGAGMSHAQLRALAEPICRREQRARVQFAGEAFDPGLWSFMHGARRSGIREADRILAECSAEEAKA